MCTVVLRHEPGAPLHVLALRDELTGREFDDPGAWWPEHPDVVGGRDRLAGGSWCVTHVPSGVTALVLNRPQRRDALPGAPSRGVLPLLATRYGDRWPAEVQGLQAMASFALVLAGPDGVACWVFDGTELTREELGAGTHMVTSGGAEDGKADRYLELFRDDADWRRLVEGAAPVDDPAALVVRSEREGKVYATVFGQLMTVSPGSLALLSSRTPWRPGTWTQSRWP